MNADDSSFRVLFLTPAMGVGGVGRQLLELSKSLSEKGHEVRILSLRPIGNFGQKARSAGISVESLGVESKLLAPVVVLKIRREIQSFEPDVVHAHLYHAIVMGRLANLGSDITLISTIHNTYDYNPTEHGTTVRDRVYTLTDRWSDLTTFVSDAALRRYTSVGAVPEAKSRRVYNGINVNDFKPLSSGEGSSETFTWISVGNLEEQKDIHTLLEAVRLLRDWGAELSVLIVGEGPLEADLKKESRKLGVEGNVQFEGRVESVVEYLNLADAFVLSSRWEGFGLVVAEAMACELPVVATNTGGPSEIIRDEETGLLAQPESPVDLADKMQDIMNMSPEERSLYGKVGRDRVVNQFSIDEITDEWLNIYEKYQ